MKSNNVVGFVVCPQVEAQLRKDYSCNTYVSHTHYWGIPILIDNRLTPQASEAYYDAALWLERVKEQNKYDANT